MSHFIFFQFLKKKQYICSFLQDLQQGVQYGIPCVKALANHGCTVFPQSEKITWIKRESVHQKDDLSIPSCCQAGRGAFHALGTRDLILEPDCFYVVLRKDLKQVSIVYNKKRRIYRIVVLKAIARCASSMRSLQTHQSGCGKEISQYSGMII